MSLDPLDDGHVPDQRELDRLVEQARSAMAWRASVDLMTGSASHDGIEVTVAATGGILDLAVPDDACRSGGDELSRLILTALHEAHRDLSGKIRASAAEAFGPESDQVLQVESAIRGRFEAPARVLDDERT